MATSSEKTLADDGELPDTRGYQREMLEESLKRNIVIALDTGAGKTHIAILRLKIEAEKEGVKKVSWFFAPNITLCEQQRNVIQKAVPVSVGIITGQLQPDQWTDKDLWATTLKSHQIIVSTPQILLDALRHGYVSLGRDIGLLVFDEAHHAIKKHPYNRIMREFYDPLPKRDNPDYALVREVRPMVLGLTASPIYGKSVMSLFDLENNLDSVVRMPQQKQNIEELSQFVHRPQYREVQFESLGYQTSSTNLIAFNEILKTLNIEDDPWIKHKRAEFERFSDGPQKTRIDQEVSTALVTRDTKVQRALGDVLRTAQDICDDLGPWACDVYLERVVAQNKESLAVQHVLLHSVSSKERRYLYDVFSRVHFSPVSRAPEDIVNGASLKTNRLIEILVEEKTVVESRGEFYSGLIFVTRRDAVIALAELLSLHPQTTAVFRVGGLLGVSDNHKRDALNDVSRRRLVDTQRDVMSDFKLGLKNLIVSTSVAEEGIDIQSCNSVIRWDPPHDMVGWKQSRGRARQRGSTYIILLDRRGGHFEKVQEWERTEAALAALSLNAERQPAPKDTPAVEELVTRGIFYKHPETGATLSIESAVSHLTHFCSILPHSTYHDLRPLFDIDPPAMPQGLHLLPNWNRVPIPVYPGPFGATVTLPRGVPAHLRVFSTPREHPNKRTAIYHVAYKAYLALYEAGLLNDHLMPFSTPLNPEDDGEVQKLLGDVEKRKGMEGVSSQMDPWYVPDAVAHNHAHFWRTRVSVEDMPPIDLLTPVPVPVMSNPADCPVLYSTEHRPRRIATENLGQCILDEAGLRSAQEYTRRFLWGIYGTRMAWENVDFAYLFSPVESSDAWDERRVWATQTHTTSKPQNVTRMKAKAFGSEFSHPTDLGIVRDITKAEKPFIFVRWRWEELSDEEEQSLLEYYAVSRLDDFPAIKYPLLVAREFPRRHHFLIPIDAKGRAKTTANQLAERILLPEFSLVDVASSSELELSLRAPSILRALEMAITVTSFRDSVLSGTPLQNIPLGSLREALLAPVAGEIPHYQRLEILGDTVLKFMSGMQLMAQHPLWHEGYLTGRKNHLVSNAQLAKAAMKHKLYRWIIRNRVLVRKWRPRTLDPAMDIDEPQADDEGPEDEKMNEKLSTKMLADVIEALIGTAYLHGSFELALDTLSFFALDFKWEPIPFCINNLRNHAVPAEVDHDFRTAIESILGYEFHDISFMIEALTHPSYQGDSAVVSYERMEFLGDSVLDMIVTDILYRIEGKNYSPGQLHLRRTAVVNLHFLAFICLKTFVEQETTMPGPDPETKRIVVKTNTQRRYLWQYLLHSSSPILDKQKETFAQFEHYGPEIEETLRTSSTFPWGALTYLEAPKFMSDMIESLIGAVYLDSGGDLSVVQGVLDKLDILPILRRLVDDDVNVLHPMSRVHDWARRNHRKVEVTVANVQVDGQPMIRAELLLDEEPYISTQVPNRGRASKIQAKFMAAEQALEAVHREFPDEAQVEIEEFPIRTDPKGIEEH